jgi:hypothetical protein
MFVFPFIEGVTGAKLEFELLILHLWFRDLLPFKSCYLLNDVNLDHPLVPRLDDSIFPGFTGLLLAKVVDNHEEGGEQFSKLCIVQVDMLLGCPLYSSLVLFYSRRVVIIPIV